MLSLHLCLDFFPLESILRDCLSTKVLRRKSNISWYYYLLHTYSIMLLLKFIFSGMFFWRKYHNCIVNKKKSSLKDFFHKESEMVTSSCPVYLNSFDYYAYYNIFHAMILCHIYIIEVLCSNPGVIKKFI